MVLLLICCPSYLFITHHSGCWVEADHIRKGWKTKVVRGTIALVKVKDDSGVKEDGHDRGSENINLRRWFEGEGKTTCWGIGYYLWRKKRNVGHMQPWISELVPPDQCRDGSRWINVIYPLGSVYAVHSTRFLWREVAELSWNCPQWWPAQLCTLHRLFFILCFPLQNPSSVPWDHFSRINSLKPITQTLLFLQELEVGGT